MNPDSKIRLSFYTYSYTDRLEMPVVAALERIAKTGYQGIDVSGTHGKSEDPRSVTPELRRLTKDTAERLGLRVEAVITHAELTTTLAGDHPLDLEGSIDLAVELAAPVVTFHMGGPPPDQDQGHATWRRVVRYLTKAVRHAEARHVKLAVDGIWPTWVVDSPTRFLEMCDEVKSTEFGVNFDPSYLRIIGLDPVEVAEQWRSRIFHGHCKDHVGKYPNWEHRIPGQGEMDYDRVVAGLAKTGFAEAIAVETFTDMPFETACDVGYATLAKARDAE
jgi:sugar phosphate isomerase/epimerase